MECSAAFVPNRLCFSRPRSAPSGRGGVIHYELAVDVVSFVEASYVLVQARRKRAVQVEELSERKRSQEHEAGRGAAPVSDGKNGVGPTKKAREGIPLPPD